MKFTFRNSGYALMFAMLTLSHPANALNELEISLVKYSDGIGGDLYRILMEANKDGAATMEVTTPSGTFLGANTGNLFVPELLNSSLVDLSFSGLAGEIGTDWTLIWDKGLTTETVATIGFGSITVGEFLETPMFLNPPNGATGVSPDTSIDWTYTIPATSAQVDRVEVFLTGPDGQSLSSGELPLSATLWTSPTPLTPGAWEAIINNAIDIRTVADGIGGPISGDPWVIANLDWLQLTSADRTSFTVVPLPGALWLFASGIAALVWGRVKRV